MKDPRGPGPIKGKMSLEAAPRVHTMDNHVDIPSLHLDNACSRCKLPNGWLAWPGVGRLQQAELHRAREPLWHHAQDRVPAMEARGACLKWVVRTKEASGGYWESRESQGEDPRGQWAWRGEPGRIDGPESSLCQHGDHKYCLARLSFCFMCVCVLFFFFLHVHGPNLKRFRKVYWMVILFLPLSPNSWTFLPWISSSSFHR